MKTVTTTKTLYTFAELSADAQKNALTTLAKFRADDWENFAAPDHIEFYEEALTLLGFSDTKVSYLGFCSQGDGLSFTANFDSSEVVDRDAIALHAGKSFETLGFVQFFDVVDQVAQAIGGGFTFQLSRSDYHYSHEYTIRLCGLESKIDLDFDEDEEAHIEELLSSLSEGLLSSVRKLMRAMYLHLAKCYFEYTADSETVRDFEESAEQVEKFTEDGKIFTDWGSLN